jgi:hypothetical protein
MRARTWLTIVLLFLLAVPASAVARGSAVIADCTDDGVLSKRYAQRDYREALANLPTDVDEYTDCRDVIRAAQLGAAGKSSGHDGSSGSTGGGAQGGGGGGGDGGEAAGGSSGAPAPGTDPLATATPHERAAFQKAITAGPAPVKLDSAAGAPVTPGSLGASSVNGLSDIPTALLVVLALLATGGLGAAIVAGRRLVDARRPT